MVLSLVPVVWIVLVLLLILVDGSGIRHLVITVVVELILGAAPVVVGAPAGASWVVWLTSIPSSHLLICSECGYEVRNHSKR